jgi:predicted SnoaL-like aldol condensation-catalyzing enzyme
LRKGGGGGGGGLGPQGFGNTKPFGRLRLVDDAKAVMRKMVEMLATGDVSAVESVVAHEYVDHQDDVQTPGRDGFSELVKALQGSQESAVSVSIADLFGERDRAVARLRWRHTKSDGSVVERETIDIVRCVNGQAVEHWGAEAFRK